MNSFQAPKGTFDLFQQTDELWCDIRLWHKAESLFRSLSSLWGFSEIRTPLFENRSLFCRSSGEASDVVEKEMYEFKDKGGRDIALRPEMTASVVRALLEHKLYTQIPRRYFYISSCFRYDRPQQGRYRQLHQWGIESIGVADPLEDVNCIALAMRLLDEMKISGVELQINSIGTEEDRFAYKKALQDFLRPHLPLLSEDSQRRFEENPLRILDSKDSRDIAIVSTAVTPIDFISEKSKAHFDQVCSSLTSLKIPFTINPRLVRGLDYYTDTVFEIVRKQEGRQNSIAGGGRYNSLVKKLSGSIDLPAFGFSFGIERVIQAHLESLNISSLPPLSPPLIIPLCDAAKEKGLELCHIFHANGIAASLWLKGGKMGKTLGFASDTGSPFVILLGEDEIATGTVTLKRLADGMQKRIPENQLLAEIALLFS